MKARLKMYRDKTHTQPVVEDPMRGGQDELMDDILSLVSQGCPAFLCPSPSPPTTHSPPHSGRDELMDDILSQVSLGCPARCAPPCMRLSGTLHL